MTQPRCITPGATWMVTRRTTRRHYLFRPDADGMSQRIYWYATAVIAMKFGVLLHATQVLSTHMHEVLTDERGELPAFLRERNRLLANALKCHRGWPEEVFQRAPASCVELVGVDAVLKEIGYTLANCVEAGLVHDPSQWPGVTVVADDLGRRVVEVERPPMYFDPDNKVWPERVTIAIDMPRAVTEAYGERASDVVRGVVARAIAGAQAAARAAGRFVGAAARLVSVPFTKRSRGFEPFGARDPWFAAAGDREKASAARRARALFLSRYRAALAELRAGHAATFPPGAWRWPRELLSKLSLPARPATGPPCAV